MVNLVKIINDRLNKAMSTLISHVKLEAITNAGNTHPLGHVRVHDQKEEVTGGGQCDVPSLNLFQSEINSLNNSLVQSFVRRVTITKAVSTSHVEITRSELGIGEVYILDVNIARRSEYNYHFVIGHGVDTGGTLFVYFDDAISATVDIYVSYVRIL